MNINNLTDNEKSYLADVQEYLAEGGIGEKERKFLNRTRDYLNISQQRAVELENYCCPKQNTTELTENELSYIEDINYYLSDDGVIDDKERKLLEKTRLQLGISEQRGFELEKLCYQSVELITKTEQINLVSEAQIKPDDTKKNYIEKADKFIEEENYTEAFYWYRLAAEENNDAYAQNRLGILYSNGQGIRQDYSQAVYWYQKSAEQNDSDAQNNLGYMYQNGYGLKQDYAKAVYWYQKSAEQNDSNAQNGLGDMYQNGYGVTQDYAKAVYWYQKSAEQNDSNGQCNLGYMYCSGNGVIQNYSEAYYWFKKSAEQNNFNAQNGLGYMYQNGYGVTQDYSEAFNWYQKSAEQNHANAQNNLGFMYENGHGITEDYAKAVYWYQKSAEQNDSDAQCRLAYMYEIGRGITKDYKEAVKLYELAIEQTDNILPTPYRGNLIDIYKSGKGLKTLKLSASRGNLHAIAMLIFAEDKNTREKINSDFHISKYCFDTNKLEKAKKVYAKSYADNCLVLFDETFWGSAKEGFILTNNMMFISHTSKIAINLLQDSETTINDVLNQPVSAAYKKQILEIVTLYKESQQNTDK